MFSVTNSKSQLYIFPWSFGLLLIVLFVLFLPVKVGHAGIFGDENFDQCVLKHMQGATSDKAASLIAASCAREFPETAPSSLSGTVYIKTMGDNIKLGSGVEVHLVDEKVISTSRELLSSLDKLLDDLSAYDLEIILTSNIKSISDEVVNLKNTLSEVSTKLDAFKGQMKTKSLELDKEKSEVTKEIERLTEDIPALQEDIMKLNTAVKSAESNLADDREKDKLEFTEIKEVANSILTKARATLDALEDERQSALSKLKEVHDSKLRNPEAEAKKAESELASAESAYAKRRKIFLAAMKSKYLKSNIEVISWLKTGYSNELCVTVKNMGAIPISKFRLDILYIGTSLSSMGLPPEDILSRGWAGVEDTGWVVPSYQNKYSENVFALSPWEVGMWEAGGYDPCVSFSYRIDVGDTLRIFEKMGGLAYYQAAWKVKIVDVELATEDSLSFNKYGNDRSWRYTNNELSSVFSTELEKAIEKWEENKKFINAKKTLKRAVSNLSKIKAENVAQLENEKKKWGQQIKAASNTVREKNHKYNELTPPIVNSPALDDLTLKKKNAEDIIVNYEKRITELRNSIKQSESEYSDFQQTIEDFDEMKGSLENQIEMKTLQVQELHMRKGNSFDELRKEAINSTNEDSIMSARDNTLKILLDELKNKTVNSVVANIDGKFTFKNFHAGKYVIYALHAFSDSKQRLWIIPKEMGWKTEVELGPHNEIIAETLWDKLHQVYQ